MYPPLYRTLYSFLQLSELEQRKANELAQRSRRQQMFANLYCLIWESGVLTTTPPTTNFTSTEHETHLLLWMAYTERFANCLLLQSAEVVEAFLIRWYTHVNIQSLAVHNQHVGPRWNFPKELSRACSQPSLKTDFVWRRAVSRLVTATCFEQRGFTPVRCGIIYCTL